MAGRLAARAVAGTCVLLTALDLWYVFTYGPNAPFADEWGLVRYLTGRADVLDLAGGVHNEHRYPLGQVAWYAVENLFGYDLRAGMAANVLLMAVTAFLLTRAAARATGGASWGDVLFPALLLNFGHDDNWLLSYQIVLTLPLAGVGGVLATAATFREEGEARVTLFAGVLTLVAMNGGAYALAATPPLAAWTLYLVVRHRRRRAFWTTAALALPVGLAAAYLAFYLATWPDGAAERPPVDPIQTADAFLKLLGYTFGGGVGNRYHPWAGLVVMAVDVVVAVRLAGVLIHRPDDRPRAWGVLAVWVAMLGVAAGLVLTRPVFGDRYALPLALHGCAAVLTLRLYPLADVRGGPPAAVALAAAVVVGNWAPGVAFGELRRYVYRQVRAEIEAGMPVRFLAERHASHLLSVLPNRVEHLGRWMDELREDRVGWFAQARATPHADAIAAPDFEPVVVTPQVSSVPIPGPGRPVVGIRVDVRTDAQVFGLLEVEWGDHGRAAVYLLGGPGETQAVMIWIDDAPGAIRFRTRGVGALVTITGLDWLTGPPTR